jgi:rhodanese-related sulfurtransferase
MKRRRFLTALGITGALAGCLNSGGDNSTPPNTATDASTPVPSGGTPDTSTRPQQPRESNALPPDDDPDDGYAPADLFGAAPPEPSVDPDSFETLDRDGTPVPLVPIDVATKWYARRSARFADARSQRAYDAAHVYGAVLSTVQTDLSSDPAGDWPETDRIVTYCGCPHHLSSMRAETLIDAGYEEVYALDEGFNEWRRQSYPMQGDQISVQPAARTIQGESATADAGRDAWAWHHPSGQREATRIARDGSYELTLHFLDVTDDSTITVETPSYTVAAPLEELTNGRVTPADARY